MNPSHKTIQDRHSYAAKQERNAGIKEHHIEKAKEHSLAKKKELAKKMYTSPTGSKHREGSAKHKYWESIEKRGKEDRKYGAGD